MKWNKEAVQDLRDYESLEAFIKSYPEQMKALEEDFCSLKACVTDKIPVMGGVSRVDDNLINNIAKRERLAMNYAAAQKRYNLIKEALDTLDERQRHILYRFFIHRQENHWELLCEELHLEKSHIYRLKDDALYMFTIAMYGMTEY